MWIARNLNIIDTVHVVWYQVIQFAAIPSTEALSYYYYYIRKRTTN